MISNNVDKSQLFIILTSFAVGTRLDLDLPCPFNSALSNQDLSNATQCRNDQDSEKNWLVRQVLIVVIAHYLVPC